MSLAIPKKKKLIRIIIVIASAVESLLNNNFNDSAEEELLICMGDAEIAIRSFPENETNWSAEQNAVWSVIEAIHSGLAPEAVSEPDYEGWLADLVEALARL